MKKILLFFAALAASQFSQAASSDCAVLNKTADRNGAVYSPVLGKKVMKKILLQFAIESLQFIYNLLNFNI